VAESPKIQCRHGNVPKYCPVCKLPPITQCTVCKDLTQTIIHELHGNVSTAHSGRGWPLCGNECAFRLKVWLKIQTPRDEGETDGSVPPRDDKHANDVLPMQHDPVESGVEKKSAPGPVL
jgi:hypothetical protein